MRPILDIEAAIEAVSPEPDPRAAAQSLLALGEEILEHWIVARDDTPTGDTREGFRLLALHRQGAKGDASFNACRETAREIAYHYNLITMQPDASATTDRVAMMKMVTMHLYLFINGKMQVAQLGDFCCSSKPIRLDRENEPTLRKEP